MAKKNKKRKSVVRSKCQKVSCEEILCAGFGGQGIMFMGKLLALAGLMAGREVTWMPSYGAEVRGGTAYSMVKISDGEIASPIIACPTILVAMNKPSFVKYEPRMKECGLIISNRSLVGTAAKKKGIALVNIPMTALAHKMGDVRCANMIAVGAVLKRSKMLSLKNVLAALQIALKNREEVMAKNKAALEKGHRW